jgi:hypothetical protein
MVPPLLHRRINQDDLFWIIEWQWAKQYRVDDGEHRRACARPDDERQDDEWDGEPAATERSERAADLSTYGLEHRVLLPSRVSVAESRRFSRVALL